MKLDEQKLRKKGWAEHEIEHARGILDKAEENKHPHMKRLEHITYGILLVIVIFGAVASAWLMEPLLLAMNTTQAIITIGIFGGLFGTLASILIQDIEHAQSHHHILLAAIIPVSAIIASITITNQANRIAQTLPNMAHHNPYVLGITFTVMALLPYGIITWKDYKKKSR